MSVDNRLENYALLINESKRFHEDYINKYNNLIKIKLNDEFSDAIGYYDAKYYKQIISNNSGEYVMKGTVNNKDIIINIDTGYHTSNNTVLPNFITKYIKYINNELVLNDDPTLQAEIKEFSNYFTIFINEISLLVFILKKDIGNIFHD